MSFIQHCFLCRPSNSAVSEDTRIEPRTVATLALAVRRSNLSARSHPHIPFLFCFQQLLLVQEVAACPSVPWDCPPDRLYVEGCCEACRPSEEHSGIPGSSVADPWRFATDPGFGSCYFRHWSSICQQKIILQKFLLITFWRYIYIIFQR